MTARSLFVAADGRLHAPWRILLFVVLTGLAALVIGLVRAAITGIPLPASTSSITATEIALQSVQFCLALLAAHAIILRVEHRTWSYVGLGREAARPRVLAEGWLLGAAAIAVPSLLLVAVGWLDVEPAPDGPWLRVAVRTSIVLLPAALAEELLTRGYIFATLREWLGWPVAVIVTSTVFGLLHLANPGADARAVILVTLAGVFLAGVLIGTASLHAAWMAHWAWNWILAVPLHVAVSGVPFERPDYQIVDSGPDWITGGAWGPEGGAGAAAGMLAGMAYLYVRRSGVWGLNRSQTSSRKPVARADEQG